MSAYPLRVVDSEPEPRRQHVASLLHDVGNAVEKGYTHELRHRLTWALANLDRLEPGTLPTPYEWIEDEYTSRLRQAKTRPEVITLTHELQKLYGLVDSLEREARDIDESWDDKE